VDGLKFILAEANPELYAILPSTGPFRALIKKHRGIEGRPELKLVPGSSPDIPRLAFAQHESLGIILQDQKHFALAD
jgi:hypothetical protein